MQSRPELAAFPVLLQDGATVLASGLCNVELALLTWEGLLEE